MLAGELGNGRCDIGSVQSKARRTDPGAIGGMFGRVFSSGLSQYFSKYFQRQIRYELVCRGKFVLQGIMSKIYFQRPQSVSARV